MDFNRYRTLRHSSDELYHWKYTKRYRKNGKWYYVYDTKDADDRYRTASDRVDELNKTRDEARNAASTALLAKLTAANRQYEAKQKATDAAEKYWKSTSDAEAASYVKKSNDAHAEIKSAKKSKKAANKEFKNATAVSKAATQQLKSAYKEKSSAANERVKVHKESSDYYVQKTEKARQKLSNAKAKTSAAKNKRASSKGLVAKVGKIKVSSLTKKENAAAKKFIVAKSQSDAALAGYRSAKNDAKNSTIEVTKLKKK